MRWRILTGLLMAAVCLFGQKYSGPVPGKADLPYLLHASNLVETEAAEAKEESGKDSIVYAIAGASSPARTPLAGPVFLLLAEKIVPGNLELYPLEVKDGRRQVAFFKNKKKQTARPRRLSVSRLGEGLFRIEVDESLENGEYSLTPSGSNRVFCFQVY